MAKAIFLDRDGTICKDFDYNNDINKLEIIEGVGKSLKKLKDNGFLLIVISNQSCVARGLCKLEEVENFNKKLNEKLIKNYKVKIDKFYFCPHHPEGIVEKYKKNCICRKPSPGMIFKARNEFNIDLDTSYLIGNSKSDIECGIRGKLKKSFLIGPDTFKNITEKILEDLK